MQESAGKPEQIVMPPISKACQFTLQQSTRVLAKSIHTNTVATQVEESSQELYRIVS